MTNMAMELTRVAAGVAALGGSSAEFSGLSDAEVLAARGPIADLLRLSHGGGIAGGHHRRAVPAATGSVGLGGAARVRQPDTDGAARHRPEPHRGWSAARHWGADERDREG